MPPAVVLSRRRLQIRRQLALRGVQQIDQRADTFERDGELLIFPVVVIDVLFRAQRGEKQNADLRVADLVSDIVSDHPPVSAALVRPPTRSGKPLDPLRRRAPQLLRRPPPITPRDRLGRMLQQSPTVNFMALAGRAWGVGVGSHRAITLPKRRAARAACRPLCHTTPPAAP